MPVATALSVIVPTYNCEAWADECLDSVLRQLPENAELIVVDDGSQDATPRLLAAYENTRKNLRIVYRPHLGASAARNAGLEAARGEFVAFLDCDDCLQDGFLAKNCPLPEQEADLTIFGIERVPLTGERELWTVNDRFYPSVHDFADDYIRKRNLLIYSNCNKLYRRRVIEQLSLRFEEDVSFGEDRLVSNHHFKWWFANSPIRAEYMRRLKAGVASHSCFFRLKRPIRFLLFVHGFFGLTPDGLLQQ